MVHGKSVKSAITICAPCPLACVELRDHGTAAHGFPGTTGDIDIFVRPEPENAARVVRALAEFGAPVAAHGVTQRDFEVEDKVYQLRLPPRRIDILTSISGVSFDEAATNAVEGREGA